MNTYELINTSQVKCVACKKDIERRILSALGKTYHPDHFKCAKCKQPIKEDKFQQHGGEPYCQDVYAKLFLKKCTSCHQPIRQKIIKALGAEWHEDCFVCAYCKKTLGGSFLEKNGKPYCEKDYQELLAGKCKGCGKPILDKVIIALNDKWHQDCFTCLKCNKPVLEDSFQVQGGMPICSKCT